ncbi:MAG TPA: FHA domain-containing protein [Bryobacteraceae bacterium]|nr:FHA domain-containing protein [Bryobacteraceae bacterium]
MTRCPEGHFFDPAKHPACPWCALPADTGGFEQKTRPVRQDVRHDIPMPPPLPGVGPLPPPPPLPPLPQVLGPSPAATVRVGMGGAKIGKNEPVVGWLVCIEGPDRGKDYRLHSEKNYIGRAPTMDVAIETDTAVSRERHGIVVFDPKKQSFWVLPGDSSGLVYLNTEMVNTPTPFHRDDVLEIGKSKLVLIPFCGDKYTWAEPAGA